MVSSGGGDGKGHLGNLGDGGNLLDLDIHVSKLRVIYFRADYFMVYKLYLRSKTEKQMYPLLLNPIMAPSSL